MLIVTLVNTKLFGCSISIMIERKLDRWGFSEGERKTGSLSLFVVFSCDTWGASMLAQMGVQALSPLCCAVLSCVRSLQSPGLPPARLLCPWGFSRQEYWSELPFPFWGDLPNPRDRTKVSCIAGGFFTDWATRKAFVNNDRVTAEFICSTAHVRQEVLTRSWVGIVRGMHLRAPPRKWWNFTAHHCCCVYWVNYKRREYRMSATIVDASAKREYFYGCCASQERINLSAVPTAPGVSS